MATLAQRLAQPDVAGLGDSQAADVLNRPDAANGTKRVDVAAVDARDLLLRWQVVGTIGVLLTRPPAAVPDAVIGLAVTVNETINPPPQAKGVLTMSLPGYYAEISAMLDQMVVVGWITTGQKAELLALADAPRSWAEANGFPNGVTARDVGLARGGI